MMTAMADWRNRGSPAVRRATPQRSGIVILAVVALELLAIVPNGQAMSSLYDLLGSTVHRARTFMIGYGPQANYTDTLGWPTIGEQYNSHIGCRGFSGQNGPDDTDVRVDDYHAANSDGKMLAYENTLDEWPV